MNRTPLAVLVLSCALAGACSHSRPRPAPPPGDPLAGVRAAALYQRGLFLAQAGDFVRAEQYLSSAIARGYPEERALPALLRVCVASSRLRSALVHAEPYLERHPTAWSLRFLVASIYLGVGDPERARASLERVIADAPAQAEPHYMLGVVLRDEVGDRPGAARRFERYLALAPGGAHAAEVRAAMPALREPVVPARGRRRAARRRRAP
jgi:tetratricopeptide (TPR) repeat protein